MIRGRGGARKSFRAEIEELKRRTRCRKCGKVGHWQKECRSTTNAKGVSKGATSSASASTSADVHFVEHRPDAAHEVSLAQSHPEEGSFNFDVTFVGAAECWAVRWCKMSSITTCFFKAAYGHECFRGCRSSLT